MSNQNHIPVVNTDIYEEPVEKPPYPLEASSWGKNSYYHHCDHLNSRVNFSVCMHVMGKWEDNEKVTSSLYGSCCDRLEDGQCPALAMRKEELEAGESLYYQPPLKVKKPVSNPRRTRSVTPSFLNQPSKRTERRLEQVNNTVQKKTVAPKKESAAPSMINMDMGKMVNDMVKTNSSQPENKVTADLTKKTNPANTDSLPMTRQSWETPLQFAKRKMAAMENKQ